MLPLLITLLLPAVEPAREEPTRVDLWLDGALTLSLAGGWIGLDLAHPHLVDTPCPCTRDQVNAFDRVTVGLDFPQAEDLADTLVISTLALAVLAPGLLAENQSTFLEDGLLSMQAMAAAGLLTAGAKITFGRPYPYMYGPAPYPEQNDDGVNYASFWSGHTAVPMAGAFAATQACRLRRPHHTACWLPALIGGALALTAGGLQIAAENHFPTDVLVGGLVGAGVGWWVPLLH